MRVATAALLLALGACGSSTTDGQDPRPEPPSEACPAGTASVRVGGSPAQTADGSAVPVRRIVLMGGSSEDDDAARAFVEAAGGGDVLIVRASGSLTSYPDYFTGDLAPSPAPASVETVLTDPPAAADHPALLCRLARAEAVWLAGGNQWNYVGGWPAAVHEALAAVAARGGAVGGTSAGAVSLGEAAFDAEHGTVTSAEALADPLRDEVSLSYPAFAQPELAGVIVDSHFMEREREGRMLAFLARFLEDTGRGEVLGIGLDERVALVIEDGRWTAYGPPERAAWLYRAQPPVSLRAGTPLTLEGVRRVPLRPGESGVWPVDASVFSGPAAQVLDVRDGVVEVR